MGAGVKELIEWYINEGNFLIRLRKVSLVWRLAYTKPDSCLHFDGARSLLHHCTNTIEELSLTFELDKNEVLNEALDLGNS